MSSALNERPSAEALPVSSGAAVLQDGHYLPPPEDKDGKQWVRTTALVQRTPQELYNLWRATENAPLWQEQIEVVVITGVNTSRWTMKDGDKMLTWDAEIVADEPGKRIVWKSIDGDLEEAGEVIFESAPGDRGTFVTVLMANWRVRGNPSRAGIRSKGSSKIFATSRRSPRLARFQTHRPHHMETAAWWER
jgi:hypothetical protein